MQRLLTPLAIAAAFAAPALGQSTLVSGAGKTGGQFGVAIAGVPDVNGDGRGDIIVGARGEGPPGSSEGRAYIYSGANGALLRTLISPHPEPDGEFGDAVAGIPDVNGDGRGDVIVGAPEEDPNLAPNDAGRAYIFSGATGLLLRELASPTQEIDGEFGGAVAGIPDVNADGRGDVAVGAPQTDPGTSPNDAGRVYIYSGATGAVLRILASPTPVIGGWFGESVAGSPDLNGDARGDLIIGAPFETGGGIATAGLVHVYSGATGARIRSLVSPAKEIGGQFGKSVASLPDANADGRPDIVVGSPKEDPGTSPTDVGRAYIYSGASGVLLFKLFPPGPEAADDFGYAVAGLVDVNGDGRGDVAVGARNQDPGAAPANCGRVHVYSGATGLRLFTIASPGQIANGAFGAAVASVPDTNGNGRGDIAIGGPGEGGLVTSGRAYLFRR